jgi:sugar phosphate isomerase/epimerase
MRAYRVDPPGGYGVVSVPGFSLSYSGARIWTKSAKGWTVIVSASTECFAGIPLPDAFDRLIDLQFASVEIGLRPDGPVSPAEVLADLEKAIALCRGTHRLGISGYGVEIDATGETFYEQFQACCRLAKSTKVASITIPSGELGTPFNEEVERLRRMVSIATLESVRISIRSQIGRLSEDPDTVVVLCDNVKGLGVTLDPSHYMCGPHAARGYDKLLPYTYNVYLRDSTPKGLQVRVGQGELDYGRLISQLARFRYDRALCVHMAPLPEVDHAAELRKLRLLLESLL